MRAEIITIGDEILIGQIVDTNSAFLGKALNGVGISVVQVSSIQDDKQHILNALKEAESRADVILITGGLGPTKDDITKYTLAEYFNDTLVLNDEVLAHVKYIFDTYITTPMSDLNILQAHVPSTCDVIKNDTGTAPGMWFNNNGKVIISMPGVPFEMKHMVTKYVLPKLQETFKCDYIIHKTVLTNGLGESSLADRMEDWENNLPSHIKLAYLPAFGRVRLRLSTKGPNKEQLIKEVDEQIEQLLPLIKDVFSGFEDNDRSIEHIVADRLVDANQTIAFAESCTGGKLTETFAKQSGASRYLKGSLVCYATQSKIDLLDVSPEIIKEHSVVSEQVAIAMAENARLKFKSAIAVSTTGNAGPDKGDSDVEVGTVCVAIAKASGTESYTFTMGNNRERVINKTINKVLELLQKEF